MNSRKDEELPDQPSYALQTAATAMMEAPDLPYRPPVPKSYSPRIALIGAGAIAPAHLDAYRTAGFDLAAICNPTISKAESLRDEFFPHALATNDFDMLLNDSTIEVFDITPHPQQRIELVENAVRSGKHVLSQKPFAEDMDTAERLVAIAKECGVQLAVNQNGRWSPHMAYMREAVQSGLIGDLVSCHTAVHWDHSWIKGTPFDAMDDLILFDFAIHWFDFLSSLAGDRLRTVHAMSVVAPNQKARPPLLAQALVGLDNGQASLIFDAATLYGHRDTTFISGTLGSLSSSGPDLGQQQVRLCTAQGTTQPNLQGTWFNDGFRGAMGELLCAVEEDREPLHSAAGNLKSLQLTFAALSSARSGLPVNIGSVRRRTA
ncbi:MAG: Gfo/Idh/MocA family protein [Rhizobiaceae bacterium]